jgi:hypothetical protein
VLRGALCAAYFALGALSKRHLYPALLGAVGQDTGLEGSYLPLAGGALFGELSHGAMVAAAARDGSYGPFGV